MHVCLGLWDVTFSEVYTNSIFAMDFSLSKTTKKAISFDIFWCAASGFLQENQPVLFDKIRSRHVTTKKD